MLYIKLVIFITQHQEVENHFQHKAVGSHLLFKATPMAIHTDFKWHHSFSSGTDGQVAVIFSLFSSSGYKYMCYFTGIY